MAGTVDILNDVNLSIYQGDSVSIVGPSGSGKTTLLMVIAGLEYITRGDIRVCDQNLSKLNEDQLAKLRGRNIGIVFQSFHLVPTMTALENVALPLEFLKISDALEKAKSILNDVGLSHRMSHFPSQLSGGEQQRVALARAMAPGPSVLLADEPTGNLDSHTGANIIEMMFKLRETHNTTLILITHDNHLAGQCETRYLIEDGRLKSVPAHLEVVNN